MSNRIFNYDFTVPSFTASNLISTSGTIPVSTFTNITKSNLVTNNVNLGISSMFSGSFSASNNVSSAANVTGLTFANASIRSFTATVTVSVVVSSGTSLYSVYNLTGTQNASGWSLYIDTFGDSTGITFSITSSGQVQYISTNISNFSSSTFRYSANQYVSSGTYTPVSLVTQGNYTIDTLQVTNTNDSVSNISNSGLYVLGGATVSKSLNVTTSISSASVFVNNSTISNIVATATSSGSINASTIAASTNITTASLSASSTTISNIVATTISSGTSSATTYTGGSLNLSSNLSIGGNITVVNVTTTNLVDTTISAGTLRTSTATVTGSITGTASLNTLGNLATDSSYIGMGDVPTSYYGARIVGRVHSGMGTVDGTNYGLTQLTLSDSEINAGKKYMLFVRAAQWGYDINVDTGNNIVFNNANGILYIASGGGANWSAGSDRRIKKNIKDLEYGIDEIAALNPVRFDYIKDTTDNSSRIGFIAQDVLPIVKESITGSEEDHYVLGSTNFIPVLVKAIKDLKGTVDAHALKIETLKKRANLI